MDFLFSSPALLEQAKHLAEKETERHERHLKTSTTKEQQEQALLERHAGNVAYKQHDFTTALRHFEKAAELEPVNIVYQNNIAAVLFEQQDFLRCVEQCDAAVDVGRMYGAGVKQIAKAFTRRAHAYHKLGDLLEAKDSYEKALLEHRTTKVLCLLAGLEKQIQQEEERERAITDPIMAEMYNTKGNLYFKKRYYMEALKHYTSAILYNSNKPKYYSNRAACCIQLGEWKHGLRDCEICNLMDPKFINGWIRKAQLYQAMNQPDDALTAYQNLLEIDPDNVLAKHGIKVCISVKNAGVETSTMAVSTNAKVSPDILAIMKDPAMLNVMKELEDHPNSWQEHRKNPIVIKKLKKLADSGIITNYDDAFMAFLNLVDIDRDNPLGKRVIKECNSVKNAGVEKSTMALPTNAKVSPDILAIMKDPAVLNVMRELEDHPNSWPEHLKDPIILNKLRKLIDCGIIAN